MGWEGTGGRWDRDVVENGNEVGNLGNADGGGGGRGGKACVYTHTYIYINTHTYVGGAWTQKRNKVRELRVGSSRKLVRGWSVVTSTAWRRMEASRAPFPLRAPIG